MTKALGFALAAACCAMNVSAQQPSAEVSYFREIRPIIQRSCQGCHQPAMKYGGPDLTRFERFAAGGGKRPAVYTRAAPGKVGAADFEGGPQTPKVVCSAPLPLHSIVML